MIPADFKDWWLAAAAISTAATATGDASAQQPEKAGVVSATQGGTKASGTPGQAGDRVLYLGDATYRNERIKNEGSGITHLLFLDQSSMTLGPNAEVVIDEFVYNPQTQTGKIAVTLASGALRVVGGRISKNTETTVATPSGTIGIRGGIAVIDGQGTTIQANYLFGQSMRTSSPDGTTQTVTRPGFSVGMSANGQTEPSPIRAELFTQTLAQFESRQTGGGVAVTQPGGAPTGQLISTGDRGITAIQDPGGSLSQDRLETTGDRLNVGDPQQRTGVGALQTINDNTLRNVLSQKPSTAS